MPLPAYEELTTEENLPSYDELTKGDALPSYDELTQDTPISGAISGSDTIPPPEPIPDVAPENRARVDADVAAAQAVMGAQMLPYRIDAFDALTQPERSQQVAQASVDARAAKAKLEAMPLDPFSEPRADAEYDFQQKQKRATALDARYQAASPMGVSQQERATSEAATTAENEKLRAEINAGPNAPNALDTFMSRIVGNIGDQASAVLRTGGVEPGGFSGAAQELAGTGQGALHDVARGTADAASLLLGNPAGKAGLAFAALRGANQTREDVLRRTGSPTEADKAAVQTFPALGLYMVGGMLGGRMGSAMTAANAAPFTKGAAGFVGAMAGNIAPSLAMRIAEGEEYGVEALSADTLMALFHAHNEYKGAVSERAQKRAEAELLSRGFSEQQIRQGYEEGGFRMRTDTPAALVAPLEVQIDLRAKAMVEDAQAGAKKILNENPPPSQQPREASGKAPDAPTPAPEGGAQPQGAAAGIVPAIRAGNEVIRGKQGDEHKDILKRLSDTDVPKFLVAQDTFGEGNFFADPSGREWSRDQLESDFGVRDSQGLRELQNAPPPPRLGQMEKQGDLLSTQPKPEPFRLAQEEAVDFDLRQRQADETARQRAESEAGQGDLFTGEQLNARMQRESEQQLLGEAAAFEKSNGNELLSTIKKLGGLPPISSESVLRGEVKRVWQANKGKMLRLVRSDQKLGLDRLNEALKEFGFTFDTPAEMLEAVESTVSRGERHVGFEPEPERRLGPGAANIEEFPPLRKIGAYNAAVDAQRAERGLSPIMSEARKADTVTWDNAERRIEADPDLPARLVEEINTGKKTSVNDEEQSALLWRIIDLRNRKQWEIERATAEDATPEIIAESQAKYDAIEQDLKRTEEADRKSGTMQGRALRIRRMLINEDHTFGGMMGRAQMAKGEKLTPQETQQIKQQADQYSKADKAFEERQRKLEEEQPVDQAIKDIEAEASKNPDFTPEVRSLADRIVSRLDQAASAALNRLRGKFAQSNIGADPTILADLVIYGSAKIAKGLVKFGRWSAEMVKEFGEGVKPYLQDAWTGANRNIDAEVQAMGGKNKAKVKDAVTKTPAVSKAEEIGAAIKARVDGGEKLGDLTGSIQRLVETLVRGGIKARDPLVDAVHDVLQKIDPKITRREAMDAISGYGTFKPLNKEAGKAEVRDLKGQLQQVAKLEDIQSKVPLSRTGVERRVPSGEERDLIKQVNEAKRKFGVVVTDPASQLKSVLDGIETRLKNQIEDIVRQLETAEGPRAKTPAPTNDKIEALRGLRDRLRDTLDSISDNGRTEEQRLSAFKQHANRRIAELEKRIRKSDFGPRPKRQPLDLSRDPAAVRAKAQMEGIKKEFQKRQFAWKQAQRPLIKKVLDAAKEVLASSRTLITSADLSAPFRQGGVFSIGDLVFNPKRFGKQFVGMLRSAITEKGFGEQEAALRLRPNADLYQKSGLYLADMDGSFTSREENMRSNLAEEFRIPWLGKKTENVPVLGAVTNPGKIVRGSNRAYAGFLNRQRADAFDTFVEMMGGKDAVKAEDAQFLAKAVNDLTGRGEVGSQYVGAMNFLSRYLFSPRFLISRIKILLGAPIFRGITEGKVSMKARGVVALQYAKFAAGLTVLYGLAKLAGATVEDDPRSSDFGKIRTGNTRLDPMAGLQQAAVLISRATSGKQVDSSGKVRPITASTFGNFLRSKLAPIPGAGINLAVGKNVVGEKSTLGSEATRLVVPMSYQDAPDVYEEHGATKGTLMQFLNLLGIGLQHYGR